MSGAEAYLALQIISECSGLLKTVKNMYTQIRDWRQESREIPQELKNLEEDVAALHVILERIEHRSKTSQLEQSTRGALLPVLRNCKAATDELKELFEKHYLPHRRSKKATIQRTVNIIVGEPRFLVLRKRIQQCVGTLTSFTSAYAPTAQEISAVITADIEAMIKREMKRLKSPIPQYRESGRSQTLASPPYARPSEEFGLDRVDEVASDQDSPSQSDDSLSIAQSTASPTTLPSVFSNENESASASSTSDAEESFDSFERPVPPRCHDALALERANRLIADGDAQVPGRLLTSYETSAATAAALQKFMEAIEKLESVSERDPGFALRRFRGLTHAHLGLTRVTKAEEREKYLENAQRSNKVARGMALRYSRALYHDAEASWLLRLTELDRANVLMRQARVGEKTSSIRRNPSTDRLPPSVLRMEAYRIYEAAAIEYEGARSTTMEYDIHAQALMGCGEVAQRLQAIGGEQARTIAGCEEADVYFNRARQSVDAGLRVRGAPGDARDGLLHTRSRIVRYG